MRRPRVVAVVLAGASAVLIPLAALTPAANASPQLASLVSPTPVTFTPNVSATGPWGEQGHG